MGIVVSAVLASCIGATAAPAPLPPVPTPAQLAWQDMEYGLFCHFGINTFHNEEWTDGTKDPKTFNPTDFDARQWVQAAKRAGMKYLVVTAKHHDGFAVYPTAYSDYAVTGSPWRDGKGDVLREVADACRDLGVSFGFYLSPWDRHEAKYADSPAYDEHFRNMLREIITTYGPVGEVWFDGAGSKGHVYDWDSYYALIRDLAPDALIAICGPDIRWVGNEDGLAPDTLWNVQERDGKAVWWPAECDVPIRKGQWFFHTNGEKKLRSLDEMLDIYYRSIGHGAVLLLNVSPDRRGRLPESDVARLMELKSVLRKTFRNNLARGKAVLASDVRGGDPAFGPEQAIDEDPATYWATDDGVTEAWLQLDFGEATAFDRVLLEEHIALGQRVETHVLEAWDGAAWKRVAEGTTIGHKRIYLLPPTTATRIRLSITKSKACPAIRAFGAYVSSEKDLKIKGK